MLLLEQTYDIEVAMLFLILILDMMMTVFGTNREFSKILSRFQM